MRITTTTKRRPDYGWTAAAQARFCAVIAEGGGVRAAARACGLSAAGAYALRKRPCGARFAADWDAALATRRRLRAERALARRPARIRRLVEAFRARGTAPDEHTFEGRIPQKRQLARAGIAPRAGISGAEPQISQKRQLADAGSSEQCSGVDLRFSQNRQLARQVAPASAESQNRQSAVAGFALPNRHAGFIPASIGPHIQSRAIMLKTPQPPAAALVDGRTEPGASPR
ncbi:hypothetical protein [Sphingomonas gilva]|uniref:hypothetical protein n=1 Tax=Sphingomonas gilva TaxID=2305907 RepID=UPI0011C37A9F|nr:hypothetical protein [Sphingomonas gilva]